MDFSFNKTLTGHTAAPVMGPDLPLFIAGILFAVVMLLNVWGLFDKCMQAMKLMDIQETVEVNEELGTYYQCIPAWTRKSMLAEEAHLRHVLKAKAFSNQNMEYMRTAVHAHSAHCSK